MKSFNFLLRMACVLSIPLQMPMSAHAAGTSTVSGRSIGGVPVQTQSAPWAASIVDQQGDFKCSGALVAPQWVVTAATCVFNDLSQFSVRIGSTLPHSGGQLVRTTQRVIHPQFETSFGNGKNIALLKLEAPVTSVTPIKLSSSDVAVGGIVSLWGYGGDTHETTAPLNRMDLKRVAYSRELCGVYTNPENGDICVATPATATPCGEDIGGALTSNGVLTGVLGFPGNFSFKKCGDAPTYTYASASHASAWISQHTGIPVDTAPPGTQTYTNSTDFPIKDRSTAVSAITVSGRTGAATANTPVSVSIVHTHIGDLKVDLVAPDSSVINLHNRTGNTTDNIIKTYSTNLAGKPLNGTWRLRVSDNAGGDEGIIDSWSITF